MLFFSPQTLGVSLKTLIGKNCIKMKRKKTRERNWSRNMNYVIKTKGRLNQGAANTALPVINKNVLNAHCTANTEGVGMSQPPTSEEDKSATRLMVMTIIS